MRKRVLAGLVVTLLVALSIVVTGAQKNTQAESMMAAAQQKENVEGDLNGAIKQYKEIADKFAKSDKHTAAMALIHAADAYRKMRNPESPESQKLYERVLREYSDQKDAVALALERLGKDTESGPTSRTVWTPTSVPNGTHWGTLSPNARFFSYSNDGDVFVHEIATNLDRNITNKPKGSKEGPNESAISPDGRRLAYVWWSQSTNRYSLRLADLAGDPNPRVLYDNPDVYDLFLHGWSPDGKTLAVVLKRTGRTSQIALVSVSDRSARPLKSVDWNGDVGWMYFSPDGKYLGYDRSMRERNTQSSVYILAIDGNGDFPAVEHVSKNQMVGWSPDGKWLLFSSDRVGTTDLWAVSVAEGKTSGQPQRLRPNIGADFHPIGWTDSGGLYYETKQSGSSTSRVYLSSLDPGLATDPVSMDTRGYQENQAEPLWSLDGKSLVYVSELRDRPGERAVLVIRDLIKKTSRELRPSLNIIAPVAWSPDGRFLFVEGRPGGFASGLRLYKLDLQNGEASLLAKIPQGIGGAFGSFEALFPSGLSFLSVHDGANGDGIFRVDTQPEKSTLLVPHQTTVRAIAPKLSKDGKKMYYKRVTNPANSRFDPSRRGARGTPRPVANGPIFFIERDLDTGKERELVQRPRLGNIHLSPDGKYIATASVDPTSNAQIVLLVPTGEGNARELMRLPSDVQDGTIGIPSGGWAPDSMSFIVRVDPRGTGKLGQLWQVPLNEDRPQRLEGKSFPVGAAVNASPDGRNFVYMVTEPAPPDTAEVAILENFLPKTTKK